MTDKYLHKHTIIQMEEIISRGRSVNVIIWKDPNVEYNVPYHLRQNCEVFKINKINDESTLFKVLIKDFFSDYSPGVHPIVLEKLYCPGVAEPALYSVAGTISEGSVGEPGKPATG